LNTRIACSRNKSGAAKREGMPRYYFGISHSGISCPDDEGEDYPGVEAALDVARRLAAELALELPELHGLTITILDESGDTVGSMLISPSKPVPQ